LQETDAKQYKSRDTGTETVQWTDRKSLFEVTATTLEPKARG